MWSGKFIAKSEIKGYHVLPTGAKKIPADDADKTKEKEIDALKLLNFTAYNELIIAQEDTVCFQIIEEARTRYDNYRDARLVWTQPSRTFYPTTGATKARLQKKFSKCELDGVTRILK